MRTWLRLPLLLAPLPSISLGDKIHKTEHTGTVHAGMMWQRAAKHFLSTASAAGLCRGVATRFLQLRWFS